MNFITIVSGLPRSGTSMMMNCLHAGGLPVLTDDIRQADEDNPLGYFEFEAVKKIKQDARWLADAPGKAVKMVYRLLYDLPAAYQYRIVFMQRDLKEVLASQKKMLARSGRPSPIADEQMEALFVKELDAFFAWITQQSNFAIIKVQYREILSDPISHTHRINEFLGGQLDELAMVSVVNPQLYRNKMDSPGS